MSGGGGGMLGPAMARFADQQQGQGQGGAGYTEAPTRATYQPAFSSSQTTQAMPQAMPQAPQGLQGLMSQIMSRYQNPYQMQMRAPMPLYQSTALGYRPSLASAQQNLNRVAPSVELQQRQAAEAEAARLKAEEEEQPRFMMGLHASSDGG